jgi:hypothetical protein
MAIPDPRKSLYIFCSGKKGMGKSYVSRAWWDGYPFDKLCIDITHDIRADFRREDVPVTEIDMAMLPTRLPEPVGDDRPRGLAYIACPDLGSATWLDDIDRVIGLCLGRGKPTLLWVDEFGEVTKANRTPPNMRRALHHGRHDDLSMLMCCPRPMDVDPLGIAQSDLIYTFKTPQVYDRQRIADTTGISRADFDAANEQLPVDPPGWHTLYDASTDELSIMPPVPARRRGRNARAPYPVGHDRP